MERPPSRVSTLRVSLLFPLQSGGVPVMVWIHGGGYALGSASQPFYNGIPLAAVGDVIIVTINYRLDVFGFLTTGTFGHIRHGPNLFALFTK